MDKQMSQNTEDKSISTSGGAYIEGNVDVQSGDFIGRDKIQHFHSKEEAYNVHGLPNPYFFLEAFTSSPRDRELYAGYKREAEKAMELLTLPGQQQSLIFITGASGSGKSSFVHAALIPKLEHHYKNRTVIIADFRPSHEPLAGLADALIALGLPADGPFLKAKDFMVTVPRESAQPYQVSVLIIDQFEELFIQSVEEQRIHLLDTLESLPSFTKFPIHIIAILRIDYVHYLHERNTLYKLATEGIVLRGLSLEELKQTIQRPVEREHPSKRFEVELVEKLAKDTFGKSTYLPLLQATLHDLWQRGSLRLGAYHNLADIIQRRADEIVTELTTDNGKITTHTEADREVILEIFLDLIDVSLDDEVGHSVRHPRSLAQLAKNDARRMQLIEKLIKSRLLSIFKSNDESVDNTKMVEIIHESLIINWQTLKDAISQKRELLRRRTYFQIALRNWEEHKYDERYLLEGTHLADAEWLANVVKDVSFEHENARRMLKHSINRQNRKRRFQQSIAAAITCVLAVFLVIALIATQRATVAREEEKVQRIKAENASKIALARQLAAQAELIRNENSSLLPVSMLLAIEATNLYPSSEADQALRHSLAILPASITRVVHEAEINVITFSPDGKYLSTGSKDKTVRIWNVSDGVEIKRISHQDEVTSINFSPDGKYLASLDQTSHLQVWDVKGWEQTIRTDSRMEDNLPTEINSVSFSPDGTLLAIDSEKFIQIPGLWLNQPITIPSREVNTTTVTSQYDIMLQEILNNSEDLLTRWTEINDSTIISKPQKIDLRSVIFSPQGRYRVDMYPWGMALWPVGSSQVITITHAGLNAFSFSPDERYLVTAGEGNIAQGIQDSEKSIEVWTLPDGKKFRDIAHGSTGLAVAFSPNGNFLATAAENSPVLGLNLPFINQEGIPVEQLKPDLNVKIWNVASGVEVALLPHQDNVIALRYSPSGNYLATLSEDGVVRVWDTTTKQEVAFLPHAGKVSMLNFSPDENYLAIAGPSDVAEIWNWKIVPKPALMETSSDYPVTTVFFDRDSKHLLTMNDINLPTFKLNLDFSSYTPISSSAKIWEIQTGQLIHQRFFDRATYWRIRPDATIESNRKSTSLYAASKNFRFEAIAGTNGIVGLLDNESRRPISITYGTEVKAISFSQDERFLATASADETARVWKTTTGKEVLSIPHEGEVNSVAFSPNGNYLATSCSCSDGVVRIWQIATAHAVLTITEGSPEKAVAFSPDGVYLATVGNNEARVWLLRFNSINEIIGRDLVATMRHEDIINAVAFSPDSLYLATGSRDKWARLWTIKDSVEIARLSHNTSVNVIAFSWDGNYLATGDQDGIAHVWLWKSTDLIREACSHLPRNLSYAEWKQYMGDEPYNKTCANLPVHPSVFEAGSRMVELGNMEGARNIFHRIRDLEPLSNFDPEKEIRLLKATLLLREGALLAIDGGRGANRALLDQAIHKFQEALELNPNLNFNPEKFARYLAAPGLVNVGNDLARQGRIEDALGFYQLGEELDPSLNISAHAWEDLCRFGSLYGYPTQVIHACELAVTLSPNDGNVFDSRGLARALMGEYDGAIEDFKFYISWLKATDNYEEGGSEREKWVADLATGKNPFNQATIEQLIQEAHILFTGIDTIIYVNPDTSQLGNNDEAAKFIEENFSLPESPLQFVSPLLGK